LLPHFAQRIDGAGNRPRPLVENAGMPKGVVAADAHHDVAGIGRHLPDLSGYAARHPAIDRPQGRLPALRQMPAQLRHHVGAAAHIGCIVEDRISKKNNVRHGRSSPFPGFRHAAVATDTGE